MAVLSPRLPKLLLLLPPLALAGCGADGNASFGGAPAPHSADAAKQPASAASDPDVAAAPVNGGTGLDAAPAPKPPEDVPPTRSLYWHWPCAKAPLPPTPHDKNSTVITGAGDFLLDRSLGPVAVEIGGQFCDSAHMARDVVFVIDVSDSMRSFLNLGNDPVRGGTCGRNDAVNAVLDALPADARAALVTFDAAAKRDSGGFLPVADFRAKYATVDVLCERGDDTNYQAGLAKALEFFGVARADASKEVYFISDGEPNSTEQAGLAEAESLRQAGTVATLMLKGDETILKEQIASRDGNGLPYHARVDDASMLAEILETLAEVHTVSATLHYGPLDQPPGTDKAVDPAAASVFALQTITIDPAQTPSGYGFTLEVLNSRGVKGGGTGRLLWK